MIVSHVSIQKTRFEMIFILDACRDMMVSGCTQSTFSSVFRHNFIIDVVRQTTCAGDIKSALAFYANPSRCPICTNRLDDCFVQWSLRARAAALPLGPVYQIVLEGVTYKSVDRAFRKRHGLAKALVNQALSYWPHELFQDVGKHDGGLLSVGVFPKQCFTLSADIAMGGQ